MLQKESRSGDGGEQTSKNWNKIEAKIYNILRLAFAAASITEDGLADFKNSRAMYLSIYLFFVYGITKYT